MVRARHCFRRRAAVRRDGCWQPVRPDNVGQRIDYAAGSVIGLVDRKDRGRWEASLSQTGRDRLKTAMAAWYGASDLSRDAFRDQMLDPRTSDTTVDRLRSAAQGVVDAQTHAELGAASADLASAVQAVGVERWPRYLADADRRAVDAASARSVPGVVKASAAGTDVPDGILLGGLILLYQYLTSRQPSSGRSEAAPSGPTIVQQAPPEKGDEDGEDAPSAGGAKPGNATLPDDRRKYILDGDGEGGGGHGTGRAIAGKSEFPQGWSDDRAIEAVKDVANDPHSARAPAEGGRTSVRGTRDGVDIEVIIGRDGKTIVTAYPTNTPRNPGK